LWLRISLAQAFTPGSQSNNNIVDLLLSLFALKGEKRKKRSLGPQA
jgi:hypothetical protein